MKVKDIENILRCAHLHWVVLLLDVNAWNLIENLLLAECRSTPLQESVVQQQC